MKKKMKEKKMRYIITLCFALFSCLSIAWAGDGCEQHRLSPEEFRMKQQAYITEKAGLNAEEASKFFPVYFELQDRKKQLNDEAWKLLRQANDDTTEAQYTKILEGVYDARIASERLEKNYFEKFKKILSCKKIFLVQKAEMRFHRELLKEMKPHEKEKGKTDKK